MKGKGKKNLKKNKTKQTPRVNILRETKFTASIVIEQDAGKNNIEKQKTHEC